MNENDRAQFVAIMGTIAESYSKEISDGLLKSYFAALSDFPIEQIEKAGRVVMRRSKFWPTVADFVEAIEGSPDDRAVAAWNLLVEALRKFSAWSSLEVTDDAAFVYAISQVFGSWVRAGDTLPDSADPMFASLRKQFIGSYRAYAHSGRAIKLPQRLAGRHEIQNLESMNNWKPTMQIPAQPCYVLTGGQWQATVLILDRGRGQFEIVKDRRQIGSGE